MQVVKLTQNISASLKPQLLQTAVSRSTVFKDDYRKVLSKFEDGYFDLALCDIPYGIDVANMTFLKEVKTTQF